MTGWVAILAVLLPTLAPAVSHELEPSGEAWVEICTAHGPAWVQASEDGTDQAPGSAHAPDHCPYCLTHAPVLGLPPATGRLQLTLQRAHEAPQACLAAGCAWHGWASAQPRAPPRFS